MRASSVRFEDQKRVPSLSYCFASISIGWRPSRPASKPASKLALKCFVLISMVSRHWSSRLALRPAFSFVSYYKLFVLLQFPSTGSLEAGLEAVPLHQFNLAGTSTILYSFESAQSVSLALSLCQYVLRPRRGLGQASPSLEAPRLQALETRDLFHQQNRKGKIVMTKTSRYKGLALGSFLAPEIDMIFGDGVGASLVLGRTLV